MAYCIGNIYFFPFPDNIILFSNGGNLLPQKQYKLQYGDNEFIFNSLLIIKIKRLNMGANELWGEIIK